MNEIEIRCPICGGYLTKANAIRRFTVKIACKRCEKWIWVLPDGVSKAYDIPPRKSISGKTFY